MRLACIYFVSAASPSLSPPHPHPHFIELFVVIKSEMLGFDLNDERGYIFLLINSVYTRFGKISGISFELQPYYDIMGKQFQILCMCRIYCWSFPFKYTKPCSLFLKLELIQTYRICLGNLVSMTGYSGRNTL